MPNHSFPHRQVETLHRKVVRETVYRLGLTEADGQAWTDRCEEVSAILGEYHYARHESVVVMRPMLHEMCRRELLDHLDHLGQMHLHDINILLRDYGTEVVSRTFTDLLATKEIDLDHARQVRRTSATDATVNKYAANAVSPASSAADQDSQGNQVSA